jgi:S1-C subfamily serine protease
MAVTIGTISTGLADVIEKCRPFVVRVEAGGRSASGFVWADGGYVITASHCFHSEQGLRICMEGGREAAAGLVGFDNRFDLALLKAETGPAAYGLRNAAETRVGELVFPLGRPGLDLQAVFGLVSARTGQWKSPLGGSFEAYLETDGVLPRGFSGGPLVDAEGRVIGMNSSLPRGLGMTVPVENLRGLVESLKTHGTPRRARLGVVSMPAELPASLAGRIVGGEGLLVTRVEPGSAALEAGLLVGDILLSLGGRRLAAAEDLLDGLTGLEAGAAIALEFARGGGLRKTEARPKQA